MQFPNHMTSTVFAKNTSPLAKIGVLVALGGALGAAGYILSRAFATVARPNHGDHSAAFAPNQTDKENFDQTRDAGAVAMRDQPDRWDALDEELDASFPSSDPPSFSPGIA
jgi:hypothetical protein